MPIKPQKLSFRDENVAAGEMRLDPDLSNFSLASKRLVLLIHGYNNTVSDAVKAYENGFIRLQQALANHAPDGNFAPDREFVEVFWKGEDWGFASFAYYANAIPNAEKTGAALARVLRKLALENGVLDVDIVAHSMGTRLALDMARNIGVDSKVRIGKLVFFASAVPTFMLEDPNERHGLRRAYDGVVRNGLLSLYSGDDMVLSVAMPIGQSLAPGPEGLFPAALGHEKWQSPRVPPTLKQEENRNAGHSDYWGWKQQKRKCEVFANMQAREYLGFSGLGDRQVAITESPARDLPESRSVATRQTPVRGE